MSESKLQQEVVKYCKTRLKETGDERYDYLVAIPNQSARSEINRRRMLAEGMRPGYPDLIMDVPYYNQYNYIEYCGLRIELKDEKGTLKNNQANWAMKLIKSKYCYFLLRDYDSICQKIDWYLGYEDGIR